MRTSNLARIVVQPARVSRWRRLSPSTARARRRMSSPRCRRFRRARLSSAARNRCARAKRKKALSALQYAAEQGHAMAQWKLGRMYAAGDGVPRSDLRAFDYFSRIADTHAEDNPNMPQARFVANAFVQLGHYYHEGHSGFGREGRSATAPAKCTPMPRRISAIRTRNIVSRGSISTASASPRDTRQAVRWLGLSANKGQSRAQAVLGNVLFKGDAGAAPAGARPDVAHARARQRRRPGRKRADWIARDARRRASKQATATTSASSRWSS